MKRILLATYDRQNITIKSTILLFTPFYEDYVERKDIQNNMILCGAYTRTSSYVPKGIPEKPCIWVEYGGYYGKEVYIMQERIPHSAWKRTILVIPEDNADEE